jgi:S1-C subfamily serine protease
MDYSALIEKVKPSIALVVVTRKDANGNEVNSFGSGFAYKEKGKLATCNHVVHDATRIQIKFAGSATLIDSTLHQQDIVHDLAILDFSIQEGVAVSPLHMPETLDVKEGHPVVFCGFPIFGTNFMSHQGMISAIEIDALGNIVYGVDGPVNKGNSGGPLFNSKGEVIGVMSAKIHNDTDNMLLGLYTLMPGAISLMGTDLVSIHKRLIDNIQLGIGVARPAQYLNAIINKP